MIEGMLAEGGLAQLLGIMAPEQELDDGEVASIRQIQPTVKRYAPRDEISAQGDPSDTTYIVISGWGCTYIDLPDGSRQIADFQLRGDIIGLRAIGANWEESFHAISDMEVLELPTSDLNRTLSATPSLAVRFLFALARNSAIRGEHIVNIGRRNAAVRLAHLMLELGTRLESVGLAEADGYDCPLTQYDLADALGLTPIHVNRMLRELRQSDLLSFRNGRVKFVNRDALVSFAHFEPDYL
ncbi:Crp/Fnr family transcriptional regulator [Oricola thermophila]|uniref:Crp/Fnr family transcriptional regulator n=1 Tax=Oricola thermophila TaxID=2742145 RepID=A0A6N1VAG9_9HYPH|nr:Crp/Fnr family transcriptional regulator [Oricola thermophila]QKV17936.1 Crp/Fnr family transcriptional regulator [Oricola thermophila]